MAIINGTANNDILTVQTDTTSVQAGAGTDTVVFSGNYADYTFSQSDSFVPLMTNNTTNQVVSLHGVEQLQFDDCVVSLQTTGSGEFQVNTEALGSQINASTAALVDGGFVVTWQSNLQDGDGYGIYAQRYDASGSAVGVELQVNTYASDNQSSPSITALADGGFVVAWNSDGLNSGIYAQIYNADGAVVNAEILLTHSPVIHYNPSSTSIVSSTNGGFIVTWQADLPDGDGHEIFAQIYDSSGGVSSGVFQVNTNAIHSQYDPSITILSDDRFLITWTSIGQDIDGSTGIYAQMYNSVGTAQGGEFQVNTSIPSGQSSQSITSLSNGGFIIAWDDRGGPQGGIKAQIFDSFGVAQGDEISVITTTSNGSTAISSLNNESFVVVYRLSDGSHFSVYAQIYDNNGNVLVDSFQVNTYALYDQDSMSVTSLSSGGFVITWQSNVQDGSNYGIYAQRYDAEGNALGEVTLNLRPTVSSAITDASTNEDASYSYDTSANFTDVDVNDVLTYSAT